MNANTPKILYFLEDAVPTPEELLEMEGLGYPVQVRNSKYVDGQEPCAGVLGAAPDEFYSDVPDGGKVMADFKKKKAAELQALRKDLEAEKAPSKRGKRATVGGDEGDGEKPKTFVPGAGGA